MSSALNIYVTEIDPTRRALAVSLIGEADIQTAPVLRGCLLRLLNRCQNPIVLDLSRLEFIDSCGISALVAGYHRAKQYDCPLSAAALTDAVAKVFQLTAVEAIIPTYPSVTEAYEAQFQLEPAPADGAPVPIETFLMRETRIDQQAVSSQALPHAVWEQQP